MCLDLAHSTAAECYRVATPFSLYRDATVHVQALIVNGNLPTQVLQLPPKCSLVS